METESASKQGVLNWIRGISARHALGHGSDQLSNRDAKLIIDAAKSAGATPHEILRSVALGEKDAATMGQLFEGIDFDL